MKYEAEHKAFRKLLSLKSSTSQIHSFHTSLSMAKFDKALTQKSTIAGRGLFASEDISAGAQIFSIARPLVAVLNTPRLTECCSNCFAGVATPFTSDGAYGAVAPEVKACSQCKLLRFCSKV